VNRWEEAIAAIIIKQGDGEWKSGTICHGVEVSISDIVMPTTPLSLTAGNTQIWWNHRVTFKPFCQPPNKYTSSPKIILPSDYLLSKKLDKYKSNGLMKTELKNQVHRSNSFQTRCILLFFSSWQALEIYADHKQVSISVNALMRQV